MAIYNIINFGARGDGKTNDAAAIQRAVDASSSADGGIVIIPAGRTYLSGSFSLKSNVELYLERGATLLASGNAADYAADLQIDRLSNGQVVEDELPRRAFIVAYRAENVAITGGGIIDGQGRAFVGQDLGYIYVMAGERQYLERPFTQFLNGCTNLTDRKRVL